MRYRSSRVVGVVSASILLLSACGGDDDSASSEPDAGGGSGTIEMTIGAVLPESGEWAAPGGAALRGVELAVDEINAEEIMIGDDVLELKVEALDSQGDATQSLNNVNRLVGSNTKVIFGPFLSASVAPSVPVTQEHDVLQFSSASILASTELGKEGNETLFQLLNANEVTSTVAVPAMKERLGLTKVGLLTTNDDIGRLHASIWKPEMEALGIEVPEVQFFEASAAPDVTPQLLRLKEAGVDAVMSAGLNDALTTTILEKQIQLEVAPIGIAVAGASVTPGEEASADLDYAWQLLAPAADSDLLTDFRAAYEEKFGEPYADSQWPALAYYNAMQMLADAIEVAGTADDTLAIADALKGLEGSGVLEAAFDDTGLIYSTFSIGYIEDGVITHEDVRPEQE